MTTGGKTGNIAPLRYHISGRVIVKRAEQNLSFLGENEQGAEEPPSVWIEVKGLQQDF